MGTMKGQIVSSATKLFDLVLLLCSFTVATFPYLGMEPPRSLTQFLSIRITLEDMVIFISLLVLWHVSFAMHGLYRSKRLSSRRREILEVFRATTTCALILACASWILANEWVTAKFVLIFWACSTISIAASRFAIRTALRRIRLRGRDLRNMLLVGSNRRTLEFARRIQSQPELGYRLIGFADQEWAGTEEMQDRGLSRLCDLDDLRTFLRRSVVDEVVITVPLRSFHDLASSVATMCQEQGIILRVLPDLFDLKQAQARTEEFHGAPLITHSNGGITDGWPATMKRALDFTLSLILLIALAPLLIVAMILIRLSSPGPIFFVQKRIGLNKRIFGIFKFRTMVADAEKKLGEIEHLNEVSGPVFKIKNDPRITPVGKFLRKTSIDELPQLFNVLRGDMSLVGPRPLQLRDYELFTDGDGEDWQRCRFSVRPGITCLWQVSGRSSLPFHRWMELDLQYVRNWSLWLDLQILAKTIPAVLRGSGAA
jgi:exopolysaccharide biosynthesis polyprenyl glycosylphosphotransferase